MCVNLMAQSWLKCLFSHTYQVSISSCVYSTLGIVSPLKRDKFYFLNWSDSYTTKIGQDYDGSYGLVLTYWLYLKAISPISFRRFLYKGSVNPYRMEIVTYRSFEAQWEISSLITKEHLLTGWSWSKSGSNLVTRWWHLSSSAIFFGNQWTWEDGITKQIYNTLL